MRIGVIATIVALMLAGCTHLEFNRTIEALDQIQLGDTQASVSEKIGPPDIRQEVNDQRVVDYYQTQKATSPDATLTKALCTSVAYESGRVVAVGDDPYEGWMREEKERQRRAEMAEQKRKNAEQAETARQKAEAERLQKIEALEAEVRPIPASNAALNLKLYRQLLELDPDRPRYQKKVAFYTQRVEQQKKNRQANADRRSKKKQRQAWEQAREARNQHLRHYTGNDTAEIAVHDMGTGELYVWIKNVSKQIITTHPDHFTLLDVNNNRARCKISDSLDSVLEPGSISHGKIEYSADALPKVLVFKNQITGRISKSLE